MPVVLTTVEGREYSGYQYDDETGVSYEYPNGKYENYILEGERFVYHLPRVGYVGSGVIGSISPSAARGRLICQILDYQPFFEPVPIKMSSGEYFEADKSNWQTGNVYWAQGVRPLSAERFEWILGRLTESEPALHTEPPPLRGGAYASPETAAAVDQYAMAAALDAARTEWPNAKIERMSHNNPGFDIRVGSPDNVVCYLEVKGTQNFEPRFWMSEGERKFSETHASNYRLIVVAGISLDRQDHARILWHQGAVGPTGVKMQPSQWRGLLLEP